MRLQVKPKMDEDKNQTQFLLLHAHANAAIECDELPENYENAKIIASNGSFYGARAEIICPPGYKTNGPKLITCLATGQWSSPLSSCIRGKLCEVNCGVSGLCVCVDEIGF